jgi:hypothetical protein
VANAAFAIANNDKGGKSKSTSTFDDLGHTIDVDQFFLNF